MTEIPACCWTIRSRGHHVRDLARQGLRGSQELVLIHAGLWRLTYNEGHELAQLLGNGPIAQMEELADQHVERLRAAVAR